MGHAVTVSTGLVPKSVVSWRSARQSRTAMSLSDVRVICLDTVICRWHIYSICNSFHLSCSSSVITLTLLYIELSFLVFFLIKGKTIKTITHLVLMPFKVFTIRVCGKLMFSYCLCVCVSVCSGYNF